MVHRLRGMFAFGIWDARSEELFLARDPYGVKPLYYADDGSAFRFASQVKALVAGGGVATTADPAGWTGFFLLGSVPEPFTTYKSITCLPAGACLMVTRDGPRPVKRYHSIAEVFREARLAMTPEPNARPELVRQAVLDSVRHHLVSDVPVGAFLSGGVDSGALVGLMRDAGQADIQTVTLAFDEFEGTPNDESVIAAEVARTYGTRHVRLR